MLEWSVDALKKVSEVAQIVVALPPDALSSAPEGTLAVAGGRRRSESVLRALQASAPAEEVVVHDAARPLAPPQLFSDALAELTRSGADGVIAAAPVSDTIKEVGEDGATVARTLDRARLWAIQTPQVFRRAALESALLEAPDELLARATDDAWLVERTGGTVRVLPNVTENFKVTTQMDLQLADRVLRKRFSAGDRGPA